MILKFPDFSLTYEDFLISLTILQNSLTFPWPWRKNKFPWLFPDKWAPWKMSKKCRVRPTFIHTHFKYFVCLFVWFVFYVPVNNLSVTSGQVFLGWTSIKLGFMCHAQGHNAVTPVRSSIKLSTTEQLPFHMSIIRLSDFFHSIK